MKDQQLTLVWKTPKGWNNNNNNNKVVLTSWFSLTLSLSLSLFLRPYHPSSPAVLLNYILCPQRADVDKFLLVGQHWHVHVKGSIEERHLWIRPCFSCSVLPLLFVLRRLFFWWEVSGRSVGVSLERQLWRNPALFYRIDQTSIRSMIYR